MRILKSIPAAAVAGVLVAAHMTSAADARRVLFIGNSLIAANNLPSMVDAIGRQGGETITSETVAYPDYSLEDHWKRGDALRALRRGGWFAIVLQQGPSALPESRVDLIAYTRKFDAEARRIGAMTALTGRSPLGLPSSLTSPSNTFPSITLAPERALLLR